MASYSNNSNTGTNSSKASLETFKNEVASSLSVNLQQGGNITAREAGSVGGEMVKRMIAYASQNMPK